MKAVGDFWMMNGLRGIKSINLTSYKYFIFVVLLLVSLSVGTHGYPTSRHRKRHAHLRSHRHPFAHDRPSEKPKCPPPTRHMPDGACLQYPCSSDDDCNGGQKCCFNGCIYTCSSPLKPPPVIDWLTPDGDQEEEEDASDLPFYNSANFEIVPGEKLVSSHRGQTGEICSTFVDPDYNNPLDCPHGYICHIEDEGDIFNGIPDRGRCVKAPNSQVFYDYDGGGLL